MPGARAQAIIILNIYSHEEVPSLQCGRGFVHSPAMERQCELFSVMEHLQISLPYPALPQAVHDRSELAVLEVVGHDDVGPSCNNFVGLLFVLDLDTS